MKILWATCVLFSTILLVNAGDNHLDASVLSLRGQNGLGMSQAQRKCVGEGFKVLSTEHPNFKPWFDDIEDTIDGLLNIIKTCSKLEGIDRLRCVLLFNQRYQEEMDRLFGNLTEEQKPVFEKIKIMFQNCMESEDLFDDISLY